MPEFAYVPAPPELTEAYVSDENALAGLGVSIKESYYRPEAGPMVAVVGDGWESETAFYTADGARQLAAVILAMADRLEGIS